MSAIPGSDPPVSINIKNFQIPFISNQGQMDQEVAFYTNTPEGTVFVTRDGEIVYSLRGFRERFTLRESFAGSRENTVTGLAPAATRVNCYLGSDPSMWRQDLVTFKSVNLGRKYKLIDVQLVADKGSVEKIFIVHPGGDVSAIRGKFKSVLSLAPEGSGDLLVSAARGKILFTRPLAFQIKDGKRLEVEASYQVNRNEYGFVVDDYDRNLPLIIDPLLASTYVGGSSNETTYAMETWGGDIFVAGTADSTDFPGLENRIDILGDAFVVRLDPDLSTIRAAAYFGGSMTEGIRKMVADDTSIYAAGYNNSPDFPTTPGAAYSGTSLSGAFVVKMDARTLRITSSTSFFANVFGLGRSRTTGDIYLTGSTGDTGIPITGDSLPAFQRTHKGGADSFVAFLDEDLTTLKGATLLGGEGFDIAYDLAVDERGYPVVVGVTNSAAFPVSKGAFGPAYNLDWEASHQWIDGFVATLTPDLGHLESATYLGGGLIDNIFTVAAQGSDVLVGGNTASVDFPCGSTYGPVDGNDAFVAVLDRELTRIRSCMVFGGSRPGTDSPESVSDVAFHPSGSIFAVGRTNAGDFPTTPGAFFSHPSGSYYGAFIIAFNRGMSEVEASTLIRGKSEDLKAVAFDIWGDVVVAGDSSASGYPVTGQALQPGHMGGDDLVVSRFTADLTGPHIELWPDTLDFGDLPAGMKSHRKIVLHNTGGSDLILETVELTTGSNPAFAINNPCFRIPAFGSCLIDTSFEPVLTGSKKGELVIYSNDLFGNQVVVELKGRGIKIPAASSGEDRVMTGKGTLLPPLDASPDPCEFGDVKIGMTLSRTVRVTNTGTKSLVLDNAALEPEGQGPFMIGEDSCSGAVLEAGPGNTSGLSYCEVRIVFTPEVPVKARARLRLSSSGSFPWAQTVMITGAGVDPENLKYPGPFGWIAILVLVLRIVLGLPASAKGWGRWMKKRNKR